MNNPRRNRKVVKAFKNEQNEDLSTFVFGKVPPQNIPAEELILGCLLIDRDAIYTVLSTNVTENSFYLDSHKAIFRAMKNIHDQGAIIEIVSTYTELMKLGFLEIIGGPWYLTELTNKVASSANLEHTCRLMLQDEIRRDLIREANAIIQRAYDPTEDVFDTVDFAQAAISEVSGATTPNQEESGSELKRKAIKDFQDKLAGKGKAINLGISDLDLVLGGASPGDLGVIAARPGMGKSALIATIAKYASDMGIGTGLVTLEMISLQQYWRLCSQVCGISVRKIKNPLLMSKAEQELYLQALDTVEEMPILYFDGSPAFTTIVSKIRKMVHKGAKMILIDYLQLIEGSGDIREQEIAKISRKLKSLAKELDIPIIILSQLSRKVEDRGGMKRPQLSDIRESGAVEQDADWVVFIWRPAYYKITKDENGRALRKGLTEFIVAKNRNGDTRTAYGTFLEESAAFQIDVVDDDLGPMQDGTLDLFKNSDKDEDLPF